ncbi:MAG: type-F conjugative transfer system pilin assembly protein TrbC [Pseudomonadota bacterium]
MHTPHTNVSLISSLVLLLASSQTLAQEPFLSGKQTVRLPTTEEIQKAQSRAREAMQRVPDTNQARQFHGGGMPNVEAMPQAAVPAPDIATIAEKYKELGRPSASKNGQPELMVLVSLSMPREALERTVMQAERAGAVLVFRGLKGDSMTKMGEEIQFIVGKRNVSAVVHPPAFQQFSVTKVPAVVIARPEAGNVLENGCSQAGTFVKVSGDVSLDYALDYIERRSPTWGAIAKAYRSRIVRGIN